MKTERTSAEHCLVGMAGFEPATPASRTRYSTKLSHIPTTKGTIAGGRANCKCFLRPFCENAEAQIQDSPCMGKGYLDIYLAGATGASAGLAGISTVTASLTSFMSVPS